MGDASEPISLPQRPQEGFVRRLLFARCDKDLRNGRTEGPTLNGRRLSESEMRHLVAYARRHGFLTSD